ncbi:glutaminase A [Myxococcus llanfairpwllgwyngyllgogerychwyrndrobwllllantysiliogogogochensis]|uniref:Glutaminase n=1 Tax=Myxococcus llanfairpwllgwyngyllgogerychwyrndrobwllllantysiliogogogochensis TaxID=2590453 RepID=A0A540WR55_9BACT|nr:glutaminase A [Myxococcus llanfairpwllgwyngyllgogerychwyrndrobwllllantysiliogogogochensis]TQF11463.1 glutaminase A [Myxococcus llanfairpwllgwyngyllgogerychwyrndrobwllllantysiliogogogochensis]
MKLALRGRRSWLLSMCLMTLAGPGIALAESPKTATKPSDAASTAARPSQGDEAMPTETEIQQALQKAHQQFRGTKEGKNADYIPYLATVNPNLFGLALVTVEGKVYTVGDATSPFPIESLSKPFTLARLMDEVGAKKVEDKIGVDATGQPFNSIVAIEMNEDHRAGNPLVNAGAITSVSMIPAATPEARWKKLSDNFNDFAGADLPVNQEVYKSETETNTRNQSISALLDSYKVLGSPREQALDLYTRQCSVNVTATQLATMGATLANGGTNPVTGKKVVSPDTARRTLALMATNGLYESTGEWLYQAGVPAKSGVGGGIVAVVPGRYAIAAFSPPLDKAGNSVRSQRAISQVVNSLGDNLYAATPGAASQQGTGGAGRDEPKKTRPSP